MKLKSAIFRVMVIIGLMLVMRLTANAESKPLPIGSEGTIVVSDFNSWEDINNLGLPFGPWNSRPDDPTQSCRIEITSDERIGDKGNSLRLIYDVDSSATAFNGFWTKLGGLDLSTYKYFVMSVKGEKETGFTPRFKIEIKGKKEGGSSVIVGITDYWQQMAVPLDSFRGMEKWGTVEEMVVVFIDMICEPKVGEIYMDDLYFSK